MKYGKFLREIIENNKGHYIDYNFLKSKIKSGDFITILEDESLQFDNFVKESNNNGLDLANVYNNLLINYLTLRKILKKLKKKEHSEYLIFIQKYGSVGEFISRFSFYKIIQIIPKKINYQTISSVIIWSNIILDNTEKEKSNPKNNVVIIFFIHVFLI